MKNPFRSIEFIFIVLLMFAAGTVILGIMIFTSISFNDFNLIHSISITISSIILFICIGYIYIKNKKFKEAIINSILSNERFVIDFKYSRSEWLPFAKKYIKKEKKYHNLQIIILVIFYTVLSVLIFLYSDYKTILLIIINVINLIIFFVIRVKFKHFKNSLITDKIPEIKMTLNGIVYNKTYLVSFNNQDNTLGSSIQYSFYGENCIALNVLSGFISGPNTVPRREMSTYYILFPKDSKNDMEFHLKLLNQINSYLY